MCKNVENLRKSILNVKKKHKIGIVKINPKQRRGQYSVHSVQSCTILYMLAKCNLQLGLSRLVVISHPPPGPGVYCSEIHLVSKAMLALKYSVSETRLLVNIRLLAHAVLLL